jgi:hypothetical protein
MMGAMRSALLGPLTWIGLACTSTAPAPRPEVETEPAAEVPLRTERRAVPPDRDPGCPAGTERRHGGDGPHALDWWCARGDVRHGPFLHQVFDERHRSWYELRGQRAEGELHGTSVAEGFYDVLRSSRSRVFRRQEHAHGRVVRSSEAELVAALDGSTPVVARRLVVKAAGVFPTVQWEGERDAIGAFDLDVSASWDGAPADAPPSVLRVEMSQPSEPSPLRPRSDVLLYPVAEVDPPAAATSLSPGYAPTVTVPWYACDPEGCEVELAITLRWIVPGPGRVEAHLALRAVPDVWTESATIDVQVIDP